MRGAKADARPQAAPGGRRADASRAAKWAPPADAPRHIGFHCEEKSDFSGRYDIDLEYGPCNDFPTWMKEERRLWGASKVFRLYKDDQQRWCITKDARGPRADAAPELRSTDAHGRDWQVMAGTEKKYDKKGVLRTVWLWRKTRADFVLRATEDTGTDMKDFELGPLSREARAMMRPSQGSAVTWVFDWCRKVPDKAVVPAWHIGTPAAVQGRRVHRCAVHFIGAVREALRDVDARSTGALYAVAVALAADRAARRMTEKDVPDSAHCDMPDLVRQLAREREDLILACTSIVHQLAAMPEIPAATWDSLRGLRKQFDGVADIRAGVCRLCTGTDDGLNRKVPRGEAGPPVIRVLAELAACFAPRGTPPSWNEIRKGFAEWSTAILMYCAKGYPVSDYSPRNTGRDFYDTLRSVCLERRIAAEQLTELLEMDRGCGDDRFKPRDVVLKCLDDCWPARQGSLGSVCVGLFPDAGDLVRFCSLLPAHLRKMVLGERIRVCLADFDRSGDRLIELCDERRVTHLCGRQRIAPDCAPDIVQTARQIILDLPLHQSKPALTADVLYAGQQTGLDIDAYLERKAASRDQEDSAVLVGVAGALLQRGAPLDLDRFARVLLDLARAQGEHAPLELCSITADQDARHWGDASARELAPRIRNYMAQWKPPKARGFLCVDITSFIREQRMGSTEQGGALWREAWRHLSERIFSADAALEQAPVHHPRQTTTCPFFTEVRAVDKWLLGKPGELRYLLQTPGAKQWAAATLLEAFVNQAPVPRLEPRVDSAGTRRPPTAVDKDFADIFTAAKIEGDWNLFRVANRECLDQLKDRVRRDAVSRREVAQLEESGLAGETLLTPDQWRAEHDRVTEELKRLQAVLRTFQHNWQVQGLAGVLADVDRALARAEDERQADLVSLEVRVRQELPKRVDALERASHSKYFMRLYDAKRQEQGRRVNLKEFKEIMDHVFDTLRGFTPQSTVEEVLLPTELDLGGKVGRLMSEDDTRNEKDFLIRDVRCPDLVVDLLVDHAAPLVRSNYLLQPFREFCDGNASPELQVRDGFVAAADRVALNQTLDEIRALTLQEAGEANARLQQATGRCSAGALQLIPHVTSCPGLVLFLLKFPASIDPDLQKQFKNSHQQAQAEFMTFRQTGECLKPFVASLARFDPVPFAPYRVRPLDSRGFFKALSELPGLDTEQGLKTAVQSIEQLAGKKVLRRLEDLVQDKLVSAAVRAEDFLAEFFPRGTVEFDFTRGVDAAGSFVCRCTLEDGSEKETDYNTFRNHYNAATQHRRNNEGLDGFSKMGYDFLHLYFMAAQLARDGHIEFCGRRIVFSARRARERGLRDVVKAFEDVRSSWREALKEASEHSPPLSLLSSPQLVYLASLMRGRDPSEETMRQAWHVITTLGADKTRGQFDETRARHSPEGAVRETVLGEDVWDHAEALQRGIKETLRRVGDFLKDIGVTGSAPAPAALPEAEEAAYLFDISSMSTHCQRQFAESRLTDLRAHSWLECKRTTTLEQVETFVRRFEVIPRGCMVVLHFQLLPTDAQKAFHSAARHNSRQKRLFLFVTDKRHAGGAVEKHLHVRERAAMQDDLWQRACIRSVHWYHGPSGCGKSSAINAAIHKHGRRPARVDLDASTSLDAVCRKLVQLVPWGSGGGEGVGDLVLHVGHDADPELVNAVLDGLILFGALESPAGTTCAASALRRWTVHIELQNNAEKEKKKASQDDMSSGIGISVLQMRKLATEHRLGPGSHFRIDFVDPLVSRAPRLPPPRSSLSLDEPPGTVDALKILREWYKPDSGGWINGPTGEPYADALYQLLCMAGNREPTPRQLEKAALYITHRYQDIQRNPFLKDFYARMQADPAAAHESVRHLETFFARCSVNGLLQHLRQHGEADFHLCAGKHTFLALRGDLPPDIKAAADGFGFATEHCRDDRVPLHRLVNVLASELDAEPKLVADCMRQLNFILTPDILKKMLNLEQHIAEGVAMILEGPSGTGKTYAVRMRAALELLSRRHKHNALIPNLARFLRSSASLKECFAEHACPGAQPQGPCTDGPHPTSLKADELAALDIAGLVDQNPGNLRRHGGELEDCIGMVLSLDDWTGLFCILDQLQQLEGRDAPLARELVDGIRAVLHGALDHHFITDQKLCADMEMELPHVARKFNADLAKLGQCRHVLGRSLVLHGDATLTQCTGAMKILIKCTGRVGTSYLTTTLLNSLEPYIINEVKPRVPGAVAAEITKRLERSNIRHVLAFWARSAVQRMGDTAPRGVEIVRAQLQAMIDDMPLAKTTELFNERVKLVPEGADLAVYLDELLCEFAKTTAASNYLQVHMRHELSPAQLYDEMRGFLQRADASKERFFVFIDEMNTSPWMGVLKRIIIDKYWDLWPNGYLPSNVTFVCAINPRERDDSLEHSADGGKVAPRDVDWVIRELHGRVEPGQVRHAVCLFSGDKQEARDYLKALGKPMGTRGADDSAERGRRYDVNELPLAARESVVPWAQLTGAGRVIFITAKLFANKTLAAHRVDRDVIEGLANLLLVAHDADQHMLLIRRSRATVSQRDIHRALIFFDDFFERDHSGPAAGGRTVAERALGAMIPAIAMSYYFRLTKADRAVLCEKIDREIQSSNALRPLRAAGEPGEAPGLGERLLGALSQQQQRVRPYFKKVVEDTVRLYFDGMGPVGDGIYPHMPLMEILFVQTVCIHNRVGVVLLGAPGTGKTQSTSIIESVCQGKTDFMRKLTSLADIVRYQGSKQSSPDEIRQKCEEAARLQRDRDTQDGKAILLLVDEAGIASSGNKMGLKVLHYYLDFMGQRGIAAVLPTNDPLDPAVSNRCVEVLLPATTAEEMVSVSECLCSAGRPQPPPETLHILRACVQAYRRIETHGGLTFAADCPRFGLRDLYSFMRFLARKEELSGNVIDRKEGALVTVTPLLLLRALEQNFNAVPKQFETVCSIFQEECDKATWAALSPGFLLDRSRRRNPLAVFVGALRDNNRARPGNMQNINDSWVRFKMLEDYTPDGSALSLLAESGLADFRDIQVLSLSALSEDDSLMEVRVVSELAAAMEAGKTVWLTHSRAIDGCLYSVFNQKYDCLHLPAAPGKEPEVACFVGLGVGGLVDQKRVHPNFQVIVHVTPDEASTLPSPFHNRLEKFALYVSDVLCFQKAELSAEVREKLEAAEQRGREFVDHIDAAERTVFTLEKEDTLAAMSLGFIRRDADGRVALNVSAELSSAARALVAAGALPPSEAPDPEAHRLWLELAAQILGICRPEGMLLAAEGLEQAKHYLVAYLSGPSCSLKRCIHLAAGVETRPGEGHRATRAAASGGGGHAEQGARKSEAPAAGPQWMLYTVHIPANTEFRRVVVSQCADVAQFVGLDSVGRVENFEERIRQFAEDPVSRVLVVDASGKDGAAVREARQLLRQQPQHASGAKAIVLLRPFQADKFESARTPLPGGEWVELYVDAAADNEGLDLAHYAGVAGAPDGGPGLPNWKAAIVEALEPIAFAIPSTELLDAVVRSDQYDTGSNAIALYMKFYTVQETAPVFRALKLDEIFHSFPRLSNVVTERFRSVMSPKEMWSFARTACKKVCSPDGTRNLARALRSDPATVLARIIQVALSNILLVDLNIVSMGVLIHEGDQDVLAAVDGLLSVLLADELCGLSAEDLRNSRPLGRPIAIGGTVPYLPGFSQVAKRMPVAPGARAEHAARELERTAGGCKLRLAIADDAQLRARFWRCCVRERVRLVRADKQDDVVDGCLVLVRSLHDAVFGEGVMTLERCRAVCSSYAPLIEAFALGLIQLAECGALTEEATDDLQEKADEIIQGPAAERYGRLRGALGRWVCDLLRKAWDAKAETVTALRAHATGPEADVLPLCTATLALLVVPEGTAHSELHGLLGGLPDCTRLAVLAAAVHADQRPGVLAAGWRYASRDAGDPDALGAFDRLCACGPAVAGAVLEQLIRCSKHSGGDTGVLYETVLLQLAQSRVRGQMTTRILAMLPRPQDDAASAAWALVWQVAGGGTEPPGDFPAPAEHPLSNPAYVAIYDSVYEELTEALGDPLAQANDRLQKADLDRSRWQQLGALHMAAVATAEARAAEAALVSILANTLARFGPERLPDLRRPGMGGIGDTVQRLMGDAKYRAHFAEELRRATQADGGAQRLSERLTHPETKRRLALMSEQLGADCDKVPALLVMPGDWPCISDDQDVHHLAARSVLQAVAEGAAKGDPAAAARCVVDAVEDMLPGSGPGLRRALVGWCASRSRRRAGKALPAAAAADPALARALDLTPASQRIMMLLFAGPQGVPGVPQCGYTDTVGEFEAWEAAAESVLAAALSCDPGSALHSMLLAPDSLRNTIILGDPIEKTLGGADRHHRGSLDCSIRVLADGYIENGRPGGTGREWADGACYLLWYVVMTLLAHCAIINPPEKPNTDEDFLWRHVFSAVATGEMEGQRAHGDARRSFNDFVLDFSRTIFAHLTAGGRVGLGYDEALRSVATTCWWIASSGVGSTPLRRRIATKRDLQEAERAFYALWERMTGAERGQRLGDPAEAAAAGGAENAGGYGRVRRPPGRREAVRAFAAVSQLFPALRQACQEEQQMRYTVPLYVRLLHMLDWIYSTHSGILPVKDYNKPLAQLSHEHDERRALTSDSPMSAARLWRLLVEAWNDYLKACGAIVRTCQGDIIGSIAWHLQQDTPISTFLVLPEDQELLEGHVNYVPLAVETLHRNINRMVAVAAGIDSPEEYMAKWDHPMLHPLLLPTSDQPFVQRPVSDVVGLLLGSCVGPGARFEFEAAEREVRRRGGDGLPLLLKPDMPYFQFRKPEVITDDCERVARELRGRVSTMPKARPKPASADLEMRLRKNFHQGFSERDALATSAAVLQLLSAQGDKMRKLGTTLEKLLPKDGGDQGLNVRLVMWADEATVAHAPLLALILAEKLETRDWDSQLPFAMAHPFAPDLADQIRSKVEAWSPGGEGTKGPHGALHVEVCRELRVLEGRMEREEKALCGAMLDEAQEEADLQRGGAAPANRPRRLAQTPLMEWLGARAQREGTQLPIASCFAAVPCSSYAAARRLVRRLAHEAEERGRNPCVQWRDTARAVGPPAADGPSAEPTAAGPAGEKCRRGRGTPPAAPEQQRLSAASAHGQGPDNKAAGRRASADGVSESRSQQSAAAPRPRRDSAASSLPERSVSRAASAGSLPLPHVAFTDAPRPKSRCTTVDCNDVEVDSWLVPNSDPGDPPAGEQGGMQDVRDLLQHLKHCDYIPDFEAYGYDSIKILAEAKEEDLERDCQVKRVHARRIVTEARDRVARTSLGRRPGGGCCACM